MKALALALLALSLPGLAHACKPAPVTGCAADQRVRLRAPTLKALEKSVRDFQKTLSAAVAGKEGGQGDCFNNQFALYYIGEVKAAASSRKHLFCPQYLDVIDAQVKKLVDPASPEWKAAGDAARLALEEQAAAVRKAEDAFQGAHSK